MEENKPKKKKPILIPPRNKDGEISTSRIKSKASTNANLAKDTFITNVENQEEWELLLHNTTYRMTVIEVYFEWAGTCSAMTIYLKKIKVEVKGFYKNFMLSGINI